MSIRIVSLVNRLLSVFGIKLIRTETIQDNLYQVAIKQRCKQIFKQSIRQLYPDNSAENNYQIWLDNIVDELEFWYITIASDGGDWRSSYKIRFDETHLFQFQKFVSHFPESVIRVLDVGAGAVTAFGSLLPGKTLDIVATDALAPAFNMILSDCGVSVKNRVEHCDAERLVEKYGLESFHFVYASNCIDHCYDPIAAIKNMVNVVKRNGTVLLGHHENVAEQENYTGLHQWNLSVKEGRFMISNRKNTYFLDNFIADKIEIEVERDRVHNWFNTTIKKL